MWATTVQMTRHAKLPKIWGKMSDMPFSTVIYSYCPIDLLAFIAGFASDIQRFVSGKIRFFFWAKNLACYLQWTVCLTEHFVWQYAKCESLLIHMYKRNNRSKTRTSAKKGGVWGCVTLWSHNDYSVQRLHHAEGLLWRTCSSQWEYFYCHTVF